jgi:hypothetical protein
VNQIEVPMNQSANAPASLLQELLGHTVEGKYRLDALLGVGGMGAVFRATRLLIGDNVAVKILQIDQSDKTRTIERFRQEAQTTARLKHPNAVDIYDFGITSDRFCYLVMELVEGQSLQDLVRRNGPLTVEAVVEIASQACAAIDEAHRLNIIHRDIKSSNIMIDATAGNTKVKVLDFGIAKLRDQAASSLTLTGSVMGTPHYMSPEQCLGEELDHRSDIYSLGIVLYEMLCGVVPFNSPTSTAVIVQHVNQAPPPIKAINMSVPLAVEAVISRALSKKREGRPSSAGTLSLELQQAIKYQEIAPIGLEAPKRIGVNAGSPWPAQSISNQTVVLSTPYASGKADITGYASANQHAPQPKRRSLWLVAITLIALATGSAITYAFLNGGQVRNEAASSGPRPEASAIPRREEKSLQTQPQTPIPVQRNTPSSPVSVPVASGQRAFTALNGVNLRIAPKKDSQVLRVLMSRQSLIVLSTGSRQDSVWIPREKGYVNGEWLEVQLEDNPSIRGWVFSYFLSYE